MSEHAPFSDEVREQAEADANWMAEAANGLFDTLEEALDRPPEFRKFIAGLMLRYGLALHDSARRTR